MLMPWRGQVRSSTTRFVLSWNRLRRRLLQQAAKSLTRNCRSRKDPAYARAKSLYHKGTDEQAEIAQLRTKKSPVPFPSFSDPLLPLGARTPLLLLLGRRNATHRLGPLLGPHLVVRPLRLFHDHRCAGRSLCRLGRPCALAVVPMPRSRRATFPLLSPRPSGRRRRRKVALAILFPAARVVVLGGEEDDRAEREKGKESRSATAAVAGAVHSLLVVVVVGFVWQRSVRVRRKEGRGGARRGHRRWRWRDLMQGRRPPPPPARTGERVNVRPVVVLRWVRRVGGTM